MFGKFIASIYHGHKENQEQMRTRNLKRRIFNAPIVFVCVSLQCTLYKILHGELIFIKFIHRECDIRCNIPIYERSFC